METATCKFGNLVNLAVTREDAGQKLLQFLQRRLNLPQSLLHRWIRTGQIRVNSHRKKAFDRVDAGDIVRIPPFAANLNQTEVTGKINCWQDKKPKLEIVEEWDNMLFINKPANLPVHGGSSHVKSVNSLLAELYKNSIFKPVAAHRLDKSTTGLLLAATTWNKLQSLQKDFSCNAIHKEYLAWVHNDWAYPENTFFRHFLKPEVMNGREKMTVHDFPVKDSKPGEAIFNCIKKISKGSLLHIRLLTGRKHQLRTQLAYLNHPVIGDGKYGNNDFMPLLLHSFRIILPDNHEMTLLPDWQEEYSLDNSPPPIFL